jgi:hypothetical protein
MCFKFKTYTFNRTSPAENQMKCFVLDDHFGNVDLLWRTGLGRNAANRRFVQAKYRFLKTTV